MTYTTLRYLIVLGLLFNALADVSGSEEADVPNQQAEDRSPSPPFGPNPHIGVYNQPNPAPILQANSPYLAPPPQQVWSSSSQTPPNSPNFRTLAPTVFSPRPIHPSAESEDDHQLNPPSPNPRALQTTDMDDTQERFAPPPSFDSMPTPEQFSSLPDFPRFDMPPVAPQFVEDPVTLEKRRKAQEEYRKAQEEYNLQCRKALEKHGLQWSEEPDRTSSPLFWRVSWGRSPYVEPEWKSSEHMQEIRAIEGQILNSLDDGKIDIGSKTDMRLHTPLMCYLGDVFWNTYVQSISNGKSRAEAIDSFIGREDDNVAVAITDNVAVAITNDSKFLDEVDKQIAEKKATPSS